MSQPALLQQLESWSEAGAIRPLDLAFTRFIRQHTSASDEAALLGVVLVSERSAHGHVCLDLARALSDASELLSPVHDEQLGEKIRVQLKQRLSPLTVERWVEQLAASEAVADLRLWVPAESTSVPGVADTPLVLGGSVSRPLLYLRRYWRYENVIREGIERRLRPLAVSDRAPALLATIFDERGNQHQTNWQKVACGLSARSAFSIITGGPGTGKTTTVVRLLALLQGLQLAEGKPPLVIRLAAPTGKAAARLNESIAGSVEALNLDPGLVGAAQADTWRHSIPTDVSTLHRLLGSQPATRHFRHRRHNPLPADIVVVDEASMVDVAMMAQLIDALRPDARLILLGDKDQLASVEAGSVLGDLCQHADRGHYHPATCRTVTQISGQRIGRDYQADEKSAALSPLVSAICQGTTMLRHCYRAEGRGLLNFAAWVNRRGIEEDGLAGLQGFFETFPDELQRVEVPLQGEQERQWQDFERLVVDGYRPYLEEIRNLPQGDAAALEARVLELFELHKQFQLLSAVRQGDFGVDGLNRRIRQLLASHQLIQAGEQQWFGGRPVLVTSNDYSLKLMNGDIGICLRLSSEQDSAAGYFRVAFPDGKGGVRWVLPSRLQGVETVFALTVHKSQGSEFAHTALILPDRPSPVLTKELLYTGITRSKQRFTLVTPEEAVLKAALAQRISRASGLLV